MNAINPRESRVVIYQGDDIRTLSDLDADVERTKAAYEAAQKADEAAPVGLMSDEPAHIAALAEYTAAQEARDSFAAGAEERGVVVFLTALPRRKWRALVAEHGPRPGVDGDRVFGVNMETFPDALLPDSVDRGRSTFEGDLERFLDALSDYDYYDRLFVTAFALNRGSAMADPTLRLLSGSSQISAEISN